MSDPRLTEERLKSWLDTNQPQRERLCVHLLPLLGDYTNVTPRRPKGGPDGARDIQAVFNNSLDVWGAVGFQNTADDSKENKKWVAKKFKDDLSVALKKKADLQGFVFFTNVDLTPGEQQKLVTHSAKNGITHCGIFYRERLRQVLDSSEGMGYRLQYLQIEMSLEEQISFIEKLQETRSKELKSLNEQQDQINEQVHRLEFLNECVRPVHEVAVAVKLNKEYTPEELGHFRIVAQIKRIYNPSPWPSLFIGGQDNYMTQQQGDKSTKIFGSKTMAWATEPNDTIHSRSRIFQSTLKTDSLWFNVPLYRRAPFPLVGDFDGTGYDIFVTKPLLDHLDVVAIIVNNFVLVELPRELIVTAEEVGLSENNPPELPEELTEVEKEVPWQRVYIRSRDTDNTALPPPKRHVSREMHFNERTPYRLPGKRERGGSLLASATLIVE